MFQVTAEQQAEAAANCNHLSQLKFSPALPHAFTEHGATMAASVLNTPGAIEASIFVVRAFARLRKMLTAHKDLERKLVALEKKYDEQFKIVFDAIRELMTPLCSIWRVLAADMGRRTQTALSRRCDWTKFSQRLCVWVSG